MSSSPDDFYRRRVRAVLRHIGAHLEEDLCLERLSEVAGMSPFHFHRQFRAITGVPVAKLVALLRLKQASLELLLDDPRVIDVALRAGFTSPEAFARAFRRAQGQSPSQFKRAPDWARWTEAFSHPFHLQGAPMDVQIVAFPSTAVAALEHQGPPGTLMRSVATFIEWRKGSDVSPNASSDTYGVPWSDPDQTDPVVWRFDICGSTRRDEVPENSQGVVLKRLPAGRCAVARHVGSTDRIGETVYGLYRDWLPGSGERLRAFPCFFHYVARMPQVSELEQITDVYLPLE